MYRNFEGKHLGKYPLKKSRESWKENIKMTHGHVQWWALVIPALNLGYITRELVINDKFLKGIIRYCVYWVLGTIFCKVII